MRIAIVDDLAAERALLKDRLEQQLHRRNVQADILETSYIFTLRLPTSAATETNPKTR